MSFLRKTMPLCFSRGRNRKNQRSQIAVIVALFIGVIFLFTIVILNIAKVSNIKMLEANAVDKAALRVASSIGSLANAYYRELGSATVKEVINYDLLLRLLLAALVTLALLFLGPLLFISPVQAILTGIGIIVSLAMAAGINRGFQEMTLRNGVRESAVYQILQSVVSDDVELKVTGTPGIFQAIDASGAFIGPTYDLRKVPMMTWHKKVSRFQAWYKTKRFPLVDDSTVQTGINNFIYDPVSGIKRYIDIDYYNPSKFLMEKFSWLTDIMGMSSATRYQVTCGTTQAQGVCPSWVKVPIDPMYQYVRVMRIDENEAVSGGFLDEKFIPLLNRLQTAYGGIYCGSCPITSDDYNTVKKSLQDTLLRFKEVVNMPVNQRIGGLGQWFPFFYWEEKHLCDPHNVSADGDYDYDIYLRLEQNRKKMEDWITALENLNNTQLVPNIPPSYGSWCVQGRGADAVSCYHNIGTCFVIAWCQHEVCNDSKDCWWVCDGVECIDWLPGRWYGDYGTCVGNGTDFNGHPVCTLGGAGDLYNGRPAWCDALQPDPCRTHSDGCGSCTAPGQNPIAPQTPHYFQGQNSFANPDNSTSAGPTEVKQAIRLLWGIINNMNKMQLTIINLYNVIRQDTPPNPTCTNCCAPNLLAVQKEYLRNNAVYAWRDKPHRDGRPQYAHLVTVNVTNFPWELPYITQKLTWWLYVIPRTRYELFASSGEFTFGVSRYDQDQPTPWWNFRRRRMTLGPEYNVATLNSIVDEVQSTGKVDNVSNANAIMEIKAFYAINSSAKVEYGPVKSDIKLTETH
jgi:hypothetical protein